MGLIGKLFGGKGDDKKGRKGAGKSSVRRNAKMPSGRRKTQSVRRMPSDVKKPVSATPAPDFEKKPAISPPSGRKVRTSSSKKRIGQLLLKSGAINEDQLDKALDIQAENGGLLGQILTGLGYCSKSDVGGAVKKQRTITTVLLGTVKFEEEVKSILKTEFCNKHRLVPFEKIGNQVCVAMANVLDAQAKSDIKEMTQFTVKPFDASWQEIQEAISKYLPEEARPKPAPISTPVQDAADDDIVIELPEDEIDLSGFSDPVSSAGDMHDADDTLISSAPAKPSGLDDTAVSLSAPQQPTKPETVGPETVSIDELRKARQETRLTRESVLAGLEELPSKSVAPTIEPVTESGPDISDDTVIADLPEGIEEEAGLPSLEELEEVGEVPLEVDEEEEVVDIDVGDMVADDTVDVLGAHLMALDDDEDYEDEAADIVMSEAGIGSDAEIVDIDDVGIVELATSSEAEEVSEIVGGGTELDIAVEEEEYVELPELSMDREPSEMAFDADGAVEDGEVAELEFVDDDGDVIDIEEAGELEVEPVVEELSDSDLLTVDDFEEPEDSTDLVGIEAFELEPEAVVESADKVAADDGEMVGIEEIESSAPVAGEELPAGVLNAIPMSKGYFSEIVQWGNSDAERRWLAEHLADNALPVVPAPELKAVAEDES